MKKLYGVTTAMVTPFDAHGGVMVEAVEKMVEFLVQRGVHCLYPCGTPTVVSSNFPHHTTPALRYL